MSDLRPGSPDALDVWVIQLAPSSDRLRDLWDGLDAREQTRARRFAFARDRDRFVARRSQVRTVLAQYVGAEPKDVALAFDVSGKPTLAGVGSLSWSHTDDIALLAVSSCPIVGADVSVARSVPEAVDLALRLFDSDHRRKVLRASGSDRDHAFAAGWVRLEARAKALGISLDAAARHRDRTLTEVAVPLVAPYVGAVAVGSRSLALAVATFELSDCVQAVALP